MMKSKMRSIAFFQGQSQGAEEKHSKTVLKRENKFVGKIKGD